MHFEIASGQPYRSLELILRYLTFWHKIMEHLVCCMLKHHIHNCTRTVVIRYTILLQSNDREAYRWQCIQCVITANFQQIFNWFNRIWFNFRLHCVVCRCRYLQVDVMWLYLKWIKKIFLVENNNPKNEWQWQFCDQNYLKTGRDLSLFNVCCMQNNKQNIKNIRNNNNQHRNEIRWDEMRLRDIWHDELALHGWFVMYLYLYLFHNFTLQ